MATVLMYHRVAQLESDVWDMAVNPDNFEQQLQVLKKSGNVVTLNELVVAIKNKSIRHGSIAITFDDGYIDNFLVAKPLLEKYQLPATFFITSGNIGQEKEFWWDELEYMILLTDPIPSVISLNINGNHIEFDLRSEIYLTDDLKKKHKLWKATEQDPPTIRSKLFMKLWESLKPLTAEEQEKYLQIIRNWIGISGQIRKDYKSISLQQLKELANSKLIDIGSHTVSHPALAFQQPELQRVELEENRRFLEEVTGKKIDLLAYPYGSHDESTVAIATNLNFTAAFTTEEKKVTKYTDRYRIGRFVVKNVTTKPFIQFLKL